jgi:hypothetical protein
MTSTKLPIIQGADLQNFVTAVRNGENYAVEVSAHKTLTFDDEEFQNFASKIRQCQASVETKIGGSSAKAKADTTKWNEFETLALDITHDYLEKLPPGVLFEHGFWCYLGYQLHDVIEWRHPNGEFSNFGSVSSQLVESLFMRVYLRRRIGGESISKLVPLQDYWRSHILRVKLGQSPVVARAVTKRVSDKKLAVARQRSIAKKINAVRSNILFELLDETQAESFAERHVQ